MLYIYEGLLGYNSVVEKICLFDEENQSATFFKKEEDLVEFIIENYCTEYNNVNNECNPWIIKLLKEEFNFIITRKFTTTELLFLTNKIKNVLY